MASKDQTNYKIVPKGYFAYNPSRINVGSIDCQSVEDRVIVSPLYVVFKADERVDNNYLLHYLKSDIGKIYINELASGSVRANLKFSILQEFPFPMIPIEEQKEKMAVIAKIDESIACCDSIIEKLALAVKSRFVEMFGNPDVNENNWETYKMEQLCDVGSSKRIYQNEQSRIGIPFLRISDLVNRMDTGSKESDLYIPEDRFEELKKQGLVPKSGDILLTAKLKSLLYGKMMFIETALKNIALNTIMTEIDSSSVYDMYDKAISSYKNAPAGTREDIKKKYQNNKLNLQGSIQNAIAAAYRKENPKITHFYNNVNYNEVPIWAIFEILTMGDFGYLLSCLTIDMREKVSRSIGINLSSDTYRELLYKYVYALKDLRNAIAHNDVVYDTRFKKMDPSRPMKQCLILEMGMPYINFKTIGDYIILICYYLKLLKVSKTEIKSFIREFEKITREYEASVNPNVSAITIHPDLFSRLGILKNVI